MFNLILENENGDSISMTDTANRYMTSKIEGLNPPTSIISTSNYAGMNGSYLNNAFIDKRNVVIHFEMRGINIEQRRHELYRIVKTSRYLKIYYRTANISVYTEGYVETCEMNNFEQLTSGQISVICPDIYWYSTESQYAYYSKESGAFTFPFSIDEKGVPLGYYSDTSSIMIVNDGDETGFTIQLEALEEVKNPCIYCNEDNSYLRINTTMQKGDVIIISTKIGKRTVVLNRYGEESNIINLLSSGSTWFTLKAGKNNYTVTAQYGLQNQKVKMIHTNAYLGV